MNKLERIFLPPDHENAFQFRGTKLVTNGSFNIQLVEDFQVQHQDIEVAIRRMAARHYRLCSTVQWDHERNTPKVMDSLTLLGNTAEDLPINLKCHEESNDSEPNKLFVAQQMMQYEINTEHIFIDPKTNKNALLWRAQAVIYPPKDGFQYVDFVLSFSHALGDGLSIAIASKTLCMELNWVLLQRWKQHKLNADEFLDTSEIWNLNVNDVPPNYQGLPFTQFGIRNILMALLLFLYATFNSIAALFYSSQFTPRKPTHTYEELVKLHPEMVPHGEKLNSNVTLQTGAFPKDSTGTTFLSVFSLSKDTTLKLRDIARSHGTTVTAALLAGSEIAFQSTLDEKEQKPRCLTWTCTASLRYFAQNKLEFGNFANLATVFKQDIKKPVVKSNVLEAHDYHSFWSLGRLMLRRTKFLIPITAWASGVMLSIFDSFPSIRDFVGANVSNESRDRHCAFDVTNLGTAMEKLFGEDKMFDQNESLITLDRVTGGMNADGSGAIVQFIVAIATTDQRLRCMVTSDGALYSQKEVDKFALDLRQVLECVANEVKK